MSIHSSRRKLWKSEKRGDFDDSKSAFEQYRVVHKLEPKRELLVVHSSRSDIRMEEHRLVGIRAKMESNSVFSRFERGNSFLSAFIDIFSLNIDKNASEMS